MTKVNLYVNSILSKSNSFILGMLCILGVLGLMLGAAFLLGFLLSNLDKYKFEAVLSKNEAKELCGNTANSGKYQFEYTPPTGGIIYEASTGSLKVLCDRPNKSKQSQSIINHPILSAKFLIKENKKEFLSDIYGEKAYNPEIIDFHLSNQITVALKNKHTGFNHVHISHEGIPTIANKRSATSVMECKSTIFNDSLAGAPWITVDKIYNDYFVSTHDINEFKHSRSEIADELLKIIDCLNRTEINELKNAESWQ